MMLSRPYEGLLPPLTSEEKEALRSSIDTEGVRYPILVTEDGRILDGHHRHELCPDAPVRVIAGSADWSDARCRAFVIRANLERRNLSADQKKVIRQQQQTLAASLRAEGWTQAMVAETLGVTQQCLDKWESGTKTTGCSSSAPDCRVKVPGSEYQRIADRVAGGELVAQVAADYGVTDRGLRKILRKHQARTEQDAQATAVTGAGQYEGTCTTEDLHALAMAGRRYGTIYVDPPWAYSNQATRAATDDHYDTMTLDDIASLPVGQLAGDYCHLHLWTTNAFLFDCPRLLDAWGFTYQGVFVWCKPQIGIGNCWRVSHEFMILAIRGKPRSFAVRNLRSWEVFDRGEHSAKPEQVRLMIEQASPGPYLELFGRRPAPGWVVWGNQIERNLFNQMQEVQEVQNVAGS